MNPLFSLKEMGFEIPWKLIKIGLYGYEEIPSTLSYEEMMDYLDTQLSEITPQTDSIVALICAKDCKDEFDKILNKYADQDYSDIVIQKRKWRAYLLKKLLGDISQLECLTGLLELMNFWVSMGIPDRCPQTFPEKNNQKSIQKYFTESNFRFMIMKNNKWLHNEISGIIEAEQEKERS